MTENALRITLTNPSDPALTPLKPGSKVALICPSGPPSPENLDHAVELLTSWGLEVVEGPNARRRHPRAKSYLAGTDAERAADLTWAYTDPEISAVFCARGGYGAIRIIDLLNPHTLSAHRKPLYGSSDITALHEYWQTRLQTPSWFSPMPATSDLLDCPQNIAALHAAVFGISTPQIRLGAETETLCAGEAEGEITGGNLSLLAMSTGSDPTLATRAKGRIVLLEEIHESPYRIDGLLQILLRSGYFAECAGIVLGTWVDCGSVKEIRDLCAELFAPLGVPVVWGARFGHGPRVSTFPIGCGTRMRLRAS